MDNQLLLQISGAAVFVLIVLGVLWMMRKGGRIMAEQEERLARSRPAKAKILQIGKSVVQERNGATIVKLRVEVMPADAVVYQATTVWEIQQASLSHIQPGQLVAVKIDTDDNQIIYPNVGWAEFSKTYWQAWVKRKQKEPTHTKQNQKV